MKEDLSPERHSSKKSDFFSALKTSNRFNRTFETEVIQSGGTEKQH